MEQATQPTTATAPNDGRDTEARASYRRARTLVDQLIDQVSTLPNAAEAHRSFALDSYEARLHFGVGHDAGRGVLQTATLVDTEPVREEKRDGRGVLIAYWIGLRTVVDGVPLSAWALTTEAEANRLLPPAETTPAEETKDRPESAGETTQPMPTVSTSPAAIVAPALTPVRPLAAKTSPETGA